MTVETFYREPGFNGEPDNDGWLRTYDPTTRAVIDAGELDLLIYLMRRNLCDTYPIATERAAMGDAEIICIDGTWRVVGEDFADDPDEEAWEAERAALNQALAFWLGSSEQEDRGDMTTVSHVLLMASESLRPHRDDDSDNVSLLTLHDKQGLSAPMCDLYDLMRTSRMGDQQLIRDVVEMLGIGELRATA